MKKHTITFVISIVILLISQQMHAQLSYKPLRDFNGDSIAYFRYNFQNDYMKLSPDRTMKFFFEKMEIPIRSFEIHYINNKLVSIALYTESVDVINRIRGPQAEPYMFFATFRFVSVHTPMQPFISVIPNLESEKILPWNDSYAELMKNLEFKTFNYQHLD